MIVSEVFSCYLWKRVSMYLVFEDILWYGLLCYDLSEFGYVPYQVSIIAFVVVNDILGRVLFGIRYLRFKICTVKKEFMHLCIYFV